MDTKLPKQRYRYVLLIIFGLLAELFLSVFDATRTAAAPTAPGPNVANRAAAIAPPDFFGVVGRDPWYEINTNPRYPGSLNVEFMENMARQMALMGARWIRIEIHADPRPNIRGGYLDFGKYDEFIFKIAPRHNLKVLALLGADSITSKSTYDPDLYYTRINDPADGQNFTNNYARFFASRAKEIADHYGDAVSAYEILNEPNIWYGVPADTKSLGALVAHTYRTLKPNHPNVKLLLGGVTAPTDLGGDPVSYLGSIYDAPAIKEYRQNNGNALPWDGIGWHPYYNTADESLDSTRAVIAKIRGNGDSSKLWVTETGHPAAGINVANSCVPTSEEYNQAGYLTRYFTEAAKTQSDIATVFWFKYEDFYDDKGVVGWGLVRLDADKQNRYLPSGKPVYVKPAFRAYQGLSEPNVAGIGLPTERVAAPPNQYSPSNPGGPFYFQQTGHTLSGPFLKYWLEKGGLELFGFPVTEVFEEESRADGKRYQVQYFERERFEYHPENAGTPYEVLLGLLGNDVLATACKSFPRAEAPTAPLPPERIYFNETGHYLAYGFKGYWQANGGLFIFGYPVSEQYTEIQPNGTTLIVQYFERARLEYHPEYVGTKAEIQLGLLGNEILRLRGWLR